jgi:nitrogen-specific signal transduction histidine kinase/CheY-like chemotaxis protein
VGDSDELLGFVAIARDLTEKKKLERQMLQAQKMEALGTLAGGIAHEFNNILATILGYAEITQDDVEPDSLVHKNLQAMETAALRAREQIRQIMTFGKLEDSSPQMVDAGEILREVIALLKNTLPARLKIKERIPPQLPELHADPSQLRRLFINLCTNSFQALGEHPGTVELFLENRNLETRTPVGSMLLEPGSYLLFTIADDGPGIRKEDLNHIFEPFFTTRESRGGTGLGLAAVHGIVSSLGGAVSVNSDPGIRTEFQVWLPLKTREKTSKSRKLEGSEQLLLVDDAPDVRELYRLILERLGYGVITASGVTEAREILWNSEKKIDLLITDQDMPDGTGMDLIREMHEKNLKLPVVLMSGYNSGNGVDRELLAALGVSRFVQKPARKAEFINAVRSALDENNKG